MLPPGQGGALLASYHTREAVLKTLLNYGMGLESTAILIRWLFEPESRGGIDLGDLIVVSAQTGDEYPTTGAFVDQHILPLLCERAIRYVQIARAGQYEKDGISILDDSRQPQRCHIEGDYTLSQEMLASGTVPQYVTGRRRCSMKYKGWPIERWLAQEFGAEPHRHILGFSADELFRVERDQNYSTTRCASEYPLVEWGWGRADCQHYLANTLGVVPHKSACTFCLAGETEVVTRDGVFPIASLADQVVDVLVPMVGTRQGLSEVGYFKPVPIRRFGIQQLYRVSLRRRRSTKVIYATAEHRWLLAPNAQWADSATSWRTTITLQPGDQLRSLRATPLAKEQPSPFAIAQGFVFGDGSVGHGDNRPASVVIHEGKDEAMLPYFALCNPKSYMRPSHMQWSVYNLPRVWKKLPDIRESRAFLLGWLAGYFAADGTVSKSGQAVLYSAYQEHIAFARSVCAVLSEIARKP